jgi:complement component 1 Q subcomponent-binding protein, mitochondrial
MSRSYEGENIVISFHTQDENREDILDEVLNELEDGFNDEQSSYNDDGDDDGADFDDNFGIDFKVTITSPDGHSALAFDCVAAMSVIIKRVSCAPSVVTASSALEGSGNTYRGPDFDRLDEGLQASFKAYLEERGIDDDMAFFILSKSQQKEQNDYLDWLHKVQTMVAR